MCNANWKLRFYEAFVKYLPRIDQDHHSIRIINQVDSWYGENFCFLTAWVLHEYSGNVVHKFWIKWDDWIHNVQMEIETLNTIM